MSRKETIWVTIILVLLGTSMHFVHHLPGFNHFWGYIFPVTESVMAHMKMIFFPMLLLAIYLAVTRRDIREFGAPILAGLAVMPAVIACFFAYWVFVRHELMALDIVIYVAAVVGAVLLARRWRKCESVRKYWPLWLALAVCCIILTGVLTYHAPDWIIFREI
ncbi:MAG: hypothetical protein IKX28_00905 [Bacteroidales bacterium]|nr:hypothetical protein [Bacteroidales bacterium]